MEGDPPQEEDFSQIPLVERSTHKSWKARLSAYNDVIAGAAKTASDTDPFFRPFVGDPALLKKWCLDANAIAQEKGVEAVLAVVTNSGETSAKLRPEIVPALVDKALGNTRAGTKRKGMDLCAMFVEVENGGEGVVTDVLVGLNAKTPKAVAGAITCLKELVEAFGVPALGNVKALLKALPKIFGHSDKNVRAEGTALTLALYTYLGPAIKPALADLKPVQVSDLEKAFEGLDAEGKGAGSGKPQRFTRKAQREREEAVDAGGDEAGDDDVGAAEEAAIDPLSLLDPVDVFALFPSDVMERLGSTKWKDRLEACEECNKVLADPKNARISDGNIDQYGPLVQLLGVKCQKDANVNVVMEAAKLLEGLATGLKKAFGRYKGVTVTPCLERLKERKASVVEALGKALDAIFLTTTLPEVTEDVLNALKSKNPQVKAGTLTFLHRSLQVTTEPPAKDDVKPMAEALVALLGDSAEPVRTAAAECLGTMMKILGERAFNPYIENVPELQLAKVKDAFGRAEIKYRPGGAKGGAKPAARAPAVAKAAPTPRPAPAKKAAPPPSSPPIKASGKFGGGDDELLQDFAAPPAKKPPARLLARMKAAAPPSDESTPPASPQKSAPTPAKPTPRPRAAPPKAAPPKAAAAPAPAASAGPSKPPAKAGAAKTLASNPSEPVKYRFSPEEAAARAAEVIPESYHTKLADAAWKVRLEAAEEMVQWAGESATDDVDSEVMMRFLGKTPGWGEKNFQVSAKLFEVVRLFAEKSPSFGKPPAALIIPPLTEKLGDMKLKKPAGDALSTIAEKTSLAFVLTQSYEPLGKQKAPKAQADALTWIKQQVIDFGIAGIPMRELISFIKTALGSPNAMVRSSATALLVQVKIFVGADISGFLEDVNPTLLGTINKEFDKVASETPPEPTREQADLREAASAGGGKGKGAGGGGADPLDDLIPRVDLDKLVNQTSILNDSKSDAWKVRKEAFEALNALLEVKSNQRLKPNMGEIGTVLKRAMSDTNLTVKMLALGITSKIATGMGPPFEKYCRLIVAPVASVCADQKATTRNAAVATLSAIADAVGSLDPMYASLGTALETTNPALRSSVLGWVSERLNAEAPSASSDLAPLAAPVISCLEDRNGDVRKGAGGVLPFVVASAGYDYVMDQTSSLKPASKATIVPMIENARGAASASASAPAAKAEPPAKAPAARAPAKPAAKATPAARAPAASIPKPSIPAPGRSIAMKALGSAPSTRPTSALSDGSSHGGFGRKPRTAVPRPASTVAPAQPVEEASGRTVPFLTSEPNARAHRLKRDATRWSLETGSRNDMLEYLHQQMEPHTSGDIFALMFSKDHRAEEDFMAALAVVAEFYDAETSDSFGLGADELHAVQSANLDLALKYAALRLLSNNTQLGARCLEVLSHALNNLRLDGSRLSDTEVRLFVPALVMKLGDPKFGTRVAPIFEGLDKLIPASQVVQLLVQFGLEDKSAGKTSKNESLQLIEKAYRKRGSVLRYDNRGFYEAVARCIADQGTRQNALTLMALLQLQGETRTLTAVIDGMSAASKDMLANRRATLAASKSGAPAMGRQVSSDAGASSRSASPAPPSRPKVANSHGSPASRLSHDMTPRSGSNSPAPGTRQPASSRGIPTASRLPTAGSATPSRASALPRPGSAAPKRTSQPVQAEEEPRRPAPRPSMMPLGRAPAPAMTPAAEAIQAIRTDDVEDAAEALKAASALLEEDDQSFVAEARQLLSVLCWQLDQLSMDVVSLLEPRNLRRVKHLMRTIHVAFGRPNIVKRLKLDALEKLYDGIRKHYAILEVWSEKHQGGDDNQAASDLRDYMSMVLSAIIATPSRDVVYTMLFDSLVSLCKDPQPTANDPHVASEIGVVLQCTYKRVRSIDNDLRNNRIEAGTLLAIIENLLQVIPPVQWRRRPKYGLPHGDLPLRVIKTLLQRIIVYTKEINVGIYDLLQEQFGAEADMTTVYSYIFRISSADDAAGSTPTTAAPAAEAPPAATRRRSHNGTYERPQSMDSAGTRSSVGHHDAAPGSAPLQKSPTRDVSEAERLVRRLTDPRDSEQRLNDLHGFMKASAGNEAEARAAISAILNPAAQTFVWRALDRRSDDAEGPRSPPPQSPVRSPVRDLASPPLPIGGGGRPSLGASRRTSSGSGSGTVPPRPMSMIDRTQPVDDQLAQLKAVFGRASSRNSGGATPTPGGTPPGRPMSEIDPLPKPMARPSLQRPMSEIQPQRTPDLS